MKSVGTKRFWQLYRNLPESIRQLAVKNYHLWRSDPNHPSLRFRLLAGSTHRFTIRVGAHHRALAFQSNDSITWVWIGTHAEYVRLVR